MSVANVVISGQDGKVANKASVKNRSHSFRFFGSNARRQTNFEKSASVGPFHHGFDNAVWRSGNLYLLPSKEQNQRMIQQSRAENHCLANSPSSTAFPPRTARSTQTQEDIGQCIQSQEKDQMVDMTEDMNAEWTKWLEKQSKSTF